MTPAGTRLRARWIGLALVAALGLIPLIAAASDGRFETDFENPPLYHPQNMNGWDHWYAQSGDTYYAYYLQDEAGFLLPTIGMATSRDLVHWAEYGEVLGINPPGQWNDRSINTGSVFRYGNEWRMVFVGQTYTGERGLGLARSDDLKNWTRIGGPLTIIYHPFIVPVSPYWQSRGWAAGTILSYQVLNDAYVIPEQINGWYYMVANALLDNEPVETRGCTGLLRSRDGVTWEMWGVIQAPRMYWELEAPQIWKHGDLWYLLFGAAGLGTPDYRATLVYTAPTMFGPFEPNPRSELWPPNYTGWFYVAKVITNPQGQDVLLGGTGGTLSRPYPVVYEADGTLTLSPYSLTLAQWVPGGLAQHKGPLVTDGVGGVISNGRSRLTANGYTVWGPLPALAATAWDADGLCGAVGVWSASGDVFAARTSASGSRTWSSSVTISNALHAQIGPVVKGDGAGGAFVAWMDFRNGLDYDIYVQHVDSTGAPQWTPNGVAACIATGAQQSVALSRDGTGGVIVSWDDARPGAVGGRDIYAQRVDASGMRQWGVAGSVVCDATGIQEVPVVEPDGHGGAYFAWWHYQSGPPRDIYMQRVDASGVAMWAPNGIVLANASTDEVLPVLAADGDRGVFVAWEYHMPGDQLEIYAQRVDTSGVFHWPSGGVPVCADPSYQTRPSIISDGFGGALVAWQDGRNDTSVTQNNYTPYVQRLGANGAPLWTVNGVRVEVATLGSTTLVAPSIAADGEGGVYVDGKAGLQRVLPDGRLAWVPDFTPTISSIVDVPDDEGGFVRMTVGAPLAQTPGVSPEIVYYQVWREIGTENESVGGRPISAAGPAARDAPIESALESGPLRPAVAGGPPEGWEIVGSFVPTGSPTYTVLVPTRHDSTGAGVGYEWFSISAHTSNPQLFMPAHPVIAYSVDNLAPAAPAGLVAGHVTGTVVRLVWNPNTEKDVVHYRVYRGDSLAFPLSASQLIGQPSSPSWEDPDHDSGVSHYKVTAVDRHSNESAPALVFPGQVSSRPPGAGPAVSYLGPIVPNPSVGAAIIEYGMSRASVVSLSIYDLSGRRVRTLVEREVPTGLWQVRWDVRDGGDRPLPAGVYIVRLVAGELKFSRKLVVTGRN